jgi:SAM-dependent methyltransferase
MHTKMQKILQHFDTLADSRIAYRKSKRYYWNSITRYCDYFLHPDYSVLEIGCGTGELLAQIKGSRKVGIDFSEQMIANAQKQFPEIEFRTMNANDIGIEETFDVVILSNLIGWLPDVQACLHEVKKVCQPRTKIIVTYYNFLWEPLIKLGEFLGIKKKTPHQNWLTRGDIINLLKLEDFDVYRHNRNMLIPFNIPGISYIFNRFLSKLPGFSIFALNQYIFAKPDIRIFEHRTEYTTSVIIPARNESGNIENAVLRLPNFGKHVEIIFIEGNSTDDTWEKIQEIQQNMPENAT